ncbi:MAG: DUF692 family protein [Clostridiales bacterium]|nr:DUF692 family protein [Clostridiales bacterium]
MKIGCNFSEELLDLLEENKVDVDYIKIPIDDLCIGHTDRVKSIRPIMVHYMGYRERTSMKDMETVDFEWINSKLNQLSSPMSAIHCFAAREDFENEEPSFDEVINRMLNVLGIWKEKLSVPVAIENYPYSDFYTMSHPITSDPRLFHILTEKLDINITLDIGHAKTSASYLGKSLKDYILEFPLDRVVELHVNGTLNDPEHGIRDKHLEMEEEDYEVVEWILRKCSIKYLTLEYGGIGRPKEQGRSNVDSIERQLRRLSRIVERVR